MLVARSYQLSNLVRLPPRPTGIAAKASQILPSQLWREPVSATGLDQVPNKINAPETDPLYLFACQVEWDRRADPSAAWEVISAARSLNENTRAHAKCLLERTQHPRSPLPQDGGAEYRDSPGLTQEAGMRTPYGLEVIESCMGCKASREGFFCRFSQNLLRAVDGASYHSVMPSGALLFVEGQTPRGVYVLCSGKVKLSTTSKEGKVLILKQAQAGEVLGLSAAISDTNYEMTAETSTPCQLDFIRRQDLMTLLQNESEVGMRAAISLSREFQGAYRDIHDLVLARSSSGKLAKLLLSCPSQPHQASDEQRLRSVMTHEEMAQRIGSSRETVTRLLSYLKKKRLIRLEGSTLVIRDRSGLEAMAV